MKINYTARIKHIFREKEAGAASIEEARDACQKI